jgi:hypothetical protein
MMSRPEFRAGPGEYIRPETVMTLYVVVCGTMGECTYQNEQEHTVC